MTSSIELCDDDQHVLVALSRAVDPDFYRSAYPDVAADGIEPFAHYARVGWREGYDPCPWFSTAAYLGRYEDVREANINPFVHYLDQGFYEGRTAEPSSHADGYAVDRSAPADAYVEAGPRTIENDEAAIIQPDPEPQIEEPQDTSVAVDDYERQVIQHEFDTAYYLATNPDVEASGIDPLDHFLSTGWREGRDPNPFFSTSDYLEAYGDVATAAINPFVHYINAGRIEGRKPKLDLGFRYDILKRSKPLEESIKEQRGWAGHVATSGAGALRSALKDLSRCGHRALHISVSHDNYTSNYGGVQLCLRREASAFEALGWDHVHLYPSAPLLVPEDEGADPVIGVVVNGRSEGFYSSEAIATVLGALYAQSDTVAAVHSLLGHDPVAVRRIIGAAKPAKTYFWIHDYASICANFNLLRNDVQFCGPPTQESQACMVCRYGVRRARQFSTHERLLQELRAEIIAPSETALAVWRREWPHTPVSHVLPHCSLVPAARGAHAPVPSAFFGGSKPITIAYLGIPSAHKGWPVFRDLALRFRDDKRYAFVHLGTHQQRGLPIRFCEVVVTDPDSNAMVEALEREQVDVSLIWSMWPETFCFTAFESVAAGALLLTGADSGNVRVLASEHGAALDSEQELARLLESGELVSKVKEHKKQRYELKYSSMTAHFVQVPVL